MKQVIGWVGVTLILIAYTLNVFGVLAASDLTYGILNLLGAFGVIISSLAKKDYQPTVLNAVWLVVALIGIIRSYLYLI
jgi:hypothetical protein